MQQRQQNQKPQLPIAADYDEAANELIKFIFHKAHVEVKTNDRSRSRPTIEVEDQLPDAKKAFKEGVNEYSALSWYWPPDWARLLTRKRIEEGNNYVQGFDLDVNGGAFQFLDTLYTALTGIHILDNNKVKVDETGREVEQPVRKLEDVKLFGGWEAGSLTTKPSMNCLYMWNLLALLPAYKETDKNPRESVSVDGLQLIAKCFVLRVDLKVREEQRKAKLKKDQEEKKAAAAAAVVLSKSVIDSNAKLAAPEPDIRASTMAANAMQDVIARLSGLCAAGKGLSKMPEKKTRTIQDPYAAVAASTPAANVATQQPAEGVALEPGVIPDAPPPPPVTVITIADQHAGLFNQQIKGKVKSNDEELEAEATAEGARYSPSMGKMKSD